MWEATVRIVAPPDKLGEVLDVLRRLKGPTEVSRGCFACRVLQDADSPDTVIYHVRWSSRDELEMHLRSDRFRTLLPYIEMSTDPPEVEISEVSAVGGIDLLVAVLGTPSGGPAPI